MNISLSAPTDDTGLVGGGTNASFSYSPWTGVLTQPSAYEAC